MIKAEMKRTTIFLGFLFFFIQATMSSAYASLCPGGTTNSPDYSNLCGIDLTGDFTSKIIYLIILFAIFGSLFFLLWGGIRWIISGGDKGKIEQARSTILPAIIGLIIALAAFFIINIISFVFL